MMNNDMNPESTLANDVNNVPVVDGEKKPILVQTEDKLSIESSAVKLQLESESNLVANIDHLLSERITRSFF